MSHLTSRLESARVLTAAGYRVIPIGENKTPAVSSWKQYQEPETVVSDAALVAWFGDESAVRGFGILGGRASDNLTVVDFDCPEGLPGDTAVRTFTAWKERVGDPSLLSRLPVVATPSGGVHVFIRSDGPADGNRKLAFATTPNGFRILIETRGEGGYVVGPGSHPRCHPSGREYSHYEGPRLPDAGRVTADELEVLLSAARTFDEKPAPEPVSAGRFQGGTPEEGRPGDDFNERTTWAELLEPRGFSLVCTDERGLSYWRRPGSSNKQSLTTGVRENGRDLLYAFSPNCGVEPDVGHTKFTFLAMVDHSGDFRTASQALREQGYGSQEADYSDVDLSKLVGGWADKAVEFDGPDIMEDPGPLPKELLDVPGFIGTYVRYAQSCGPKPQPELALGGALVALAALTARKVVFPPDGRANVFCVNLGGSGTGKKSAFTAMKNIAAGVCQRVAVPGRGFVETGLPKSDAGVMQSLFSEPSTAWLIDECGDFLSAVGSAKASPHLKAIVRVMTDLYTSSNDKLFSGGAYADPKNRVSVAFPNLSLLGASTTKEFVEALSSSMKSGGFVGRLLVFRANENAKPQKGRTIDKEAENWLTDFAMEWCLWKPFQMFDQYPDPVEATVTDEAVARLDLWYDTCEERSREREDDVWRSIWGRAIEKAGKLAFLHAASQVVRPDSAAVNIDGESAAWGVAVAGHSIRSLLFLLDRFASDSKAESILKAVRRAISEFPDGVAPKNQLTRKLQRFSSSERDQAITTLIESDELFKSQSQTSGRAKLIYLTPEAVKRLENDLTA